MMCDFRLKSVIKQLHEFEQKYQEYQDQMIIFEAEIINLKEGEMKKSTN